MKQFISVEEVLSILKMHSPLLQTRRLPLDQCLGRKLSNDIHAKVTLPPANVSAMDGYAVRLSDVATSGAALTVIGEAAAGNPFGGQLQAGEAVRIFTGAEVPSGADHVVVQEVTRRDGDGVTIDEAYAKAANIRKAGIDFTVDDLLVPAGAFIGPAELALAAAANHKDLPVFKRPKVALLANGDELKPPGSSLGRGEIINSNPAALGALITQWGGEPVDLGIAPDSIEAIQAYIQKASTADIIVPIGGASVGDHDHMRAAFKGLSFETIFEKVAIKPGKPTWFAKKDAQCVLGLPGNPASALVCAHIFLRQLINPDRQHIWQKAKLGTKLKGNVPRTSFLRAYVEGNQKGELIVTPMANQDSSLLTPFLKTNAFIRLAPNQAALEKDAIVSILHLPL